jgi:hypothetical protein
VKKSNSSLQARSSRRDSVSVCLTAKQKIYPSSCSTTWNANVARRSAVVVSFARFLAIRAAHTTPSSNDAERRSTFSSIELDDAFVSQVYRILTPHVRQSARQSRPLSEGVSRCEASPAIYPRRCLVRVPQMAEPRSSVLLENFHAKRNIFLARFCSSVFRFTWFTSRRTEITQPRI